MDNSKLRESIESIIDDLLFAVYQSSGLRYSDGQVGEVTDSIMDAIKKAGKLKETE
jgi:hypothetical protein